MRERERKFSVGLYTLRMRIVYQHPLERLVALSLLCWCCASHSHPHRRRNARLLLVNNTRTWQSFVSVMKKTLNIAKRFLCWASPKLQSSARRWFFSFFLLLSLEEYKNSDFIHRQHTSERFDASFESHFQLRFRCSPLINFFYSPKSSFLNFKVTTRATHNIKNSILVKWKIEGGAQWMGRTSSQFSFFYHSPSTLFSCAILKSMFNTCLEFWIPFGAIDRVVEYPALWPGTMYSIFVNEFSEFDVRNFFCDFLCDVARKMMLSCHRGGHASQHKVTAVIFFRVFRHSVSSSVASSSSSVGSIMFQCQRRMWMVGESFHFFGCTFS